MALSACRSAADCCTNPGIDPPKAEVVQLCNSARRHQEVQAHRAPDTLRGRASLPGTELWLLERTRKCLRTALLPRTRSQVVKPQAGVPAKLPATKARWQDKQGRHNVRRTSSDASVQWLRCRRRAYQVRCHSWQTPFLLVEPFYLEGVSQMDSILPERLLALVRPAFDLVLRRIQSLKRCVQACGCKIMTPRYACNLAPGYFKRANLRRAKKKQKKKKRKKRGPKKRGPRKKRKRGFLWLTSLEMQPGAKLRRISRGHYFAATRLHAAF